MERDMVDEKLHISWQLASRERQEGLGGQWFLLGHTLVTVSFNPPPAPHSTSASNSSWITQNAWQAGLGDPISFFSAVWDTLWGNEALWRHMARRATDDCCGTGC